MYSKFDLNRIIRWKKRRARPGSGRSISIQSNGLAGVPAGADDYEKIRYVYEYIILNTDYNLEAEDNQNICSTFIGRQTVCQGYASGMQYLLQKLEIPCTVVTGQIAARGNHAWNMVIADGEYYYVDATWGDPSYGEGSMENQGINYQYLMVNSADLAKTHVADPDFLWPVTESRKDNYYIREGLYMEQWEDGWIEELIRSALENGEHLFSFRTSPDAAEETKDNLITGFRHLQTHTQRTGVKQHKRTACFGSFLQYGRTDECIHVFS